MLTESLIRTSSGIACWTIGTGPPLVCVPGGPGIDHAFFRPALDALASARTVVYFDLPGHGRSDAPAAYDTHTMAMGIDDIRAHLGVERISLLGSSYGGYLSLLYARQYPDRVRSMVLVSTAAAYCFRKESVRIATRHGDPGMLAAIARLRSGNITTDEEFHALMRIVAPLYFHRLPLDEIHAIADAATYRVNARHAVIPTLNEFNIRDDLERITPLSLVIGGRHDWIIGVAHAVELAAGLPVSDLVICEDSGHYPFLDEPEAFIWTVDEWLRSHGA
jgi:proline iminopeptidase